MASEARFLVLTDLHLAGILKRDEIKSPSITKNENPSRITPKRKKKSSIADYLRRRHLTLEAVIFAGDAQDKGSKGSHDAAYQSIVDAFQGFGIEGIAAGLGRTLRRFCFRVARQGLHRSMDRWPRSPIAFRYGSTSPRRGRRSMGHIPFEYEQLVAGSRKCSQRLGNCLG